MFRSESDSQQRGDQGTSVGKYLYYKAKKWGCLFQMVFNEIKVNKGLVNSASGSSNIMKG